jgi:hypothetical protein
MARRTAGRLGEGGGPGSGVRIFPPPHPAVRGKAEVLQVGTGDAAHQRVSVQAGPGPSLEVSETELLLHPDTSKYPLRCSLRERDRHFGS